MSSEGVSYKEIEVGISKAKEGSLWRRSAFIELRFEVCL